MSKCCKDTKYARERKAGRKEVSIASQDAIVNKSHCREAGPINGGWASRAMKGSSQSQVTFLPQRIMFGSETMRCKKGHPVLVLCYQYLERP
jgi:hypothetical protein